MKRRYLAQFVSSLPSLDSAIRDTADQTRRLQDYLDAMNEYSSAARLGSRGEAAQEAGKSS